MRYLICALVMTAPVLTVLCALAGLVFGPKDIGPR